MKSSILLFILALELIFLSWPVPEKPMHFGVDGVQIEERLPFGRIVK